VRAAIVGAEHGGRRTALLLALILGLRSPIGARAQPAVTVVTIGVLAIEPCPRMDAFRDARRDPGVE
jgi:hypothetical protein